MTHAEARSTAQRRADTIVKLQSPAADVWVATAGVDDDGTARPHLVPVSLAWLDDRAVIAIPRASRTARDITAHRRARLGVGPTRDVVMIDAVLDEEHDVVGAAGWLGDGYANQADWDPREAEGDYVYLILRPMRVQAWRESNEIEGRTLMRHGTWLT